MASGSSPRLDQAGMSGRGLPGNVIFFWQFTPTCEILCDISGFVTISCPPPQPLQGWSWWCPSSHSTTPRLFTPNFAIRPNFNLQVPLQSEIQTFINQNIQLRFVQSIYFVNIFNSWKSWVNFICGGNAVKVTGMCGEEDNPLKWSSKALLADRLGSLFSSNCLLIWWGGSGGVPSGLKLKRENNHYLENLRWHFGLVC